MTLSTKFFIRRVSFSFWWETKSPFRENEEGVGTKNGKPIKTV